MSDSDGMHVDMIEGRFYFFCGGGYLCYDFMFTVMTLIFAPYYDHHGSLSSIVLHNFQKKSQQYQCDIAHFLQYLISN